VFFVSMGMNTHFITNFDLGLVVVLTVVAFGSKLGAVLLGALAARMPLDRNTWAIAFGLNARGATGIILAGVGLSAGVIDDRIFVAIVVMCLIISMVAGPAVNALLDLRAVVPVEPTSEDDANVETIPTNEKSMAPMA
jgi:Kef-type K+ transport system membrane component KefB